MKYYISTLNALKDAQRGAAMPEYALLVALIAVVVITGATALGLAIDTKFTDIGGKITAAN